MKVEGKIKHIGQTQEFGSNGFKKRELVVTTQEQYPQHIMVEFVQDKCIILDNYQIGQDVEVGVNLRGREWLNPQGETKYFNSIQGWRISQSGNPTNSAVEAYKEPEVPQGFDYEAEEEEDDLPF